MAALEAQVRQLEAVVVAIGALVVDELEPNGPARIIDKANALGARYLEAGQPDAARLMSAFRDAIPKPWSFFRWLDAKLS